MRCCRCAAQRESADPAIQGVSKSGQRLSSIKTEALFIHVPGRCHFEPLALLHFLFLRAIAIPNKGADTEILTVFVLSK